jgi:hypothetical protein
VQRATTGDCEAVLLRMSCDFVVGGFARATRDYGRLRSCTVANDVGLMW